MTDSDANVDQNAKQKSGNLDEDCEKVVSHVACVTLESDSLPDTPDMPRAARKKKRLVRRPRSCKMDVDPQPTTSQSKPDSRMEWDGAESCLSSTSESDDGNTAADADDEQSDWVGPDLLKDPLDERRGRRLQQKLQMSQLQRRLERFAFDGGRGEMGIEFRIKDRPNSIQIGDYNESTRKGSVIVAGEDAQLVWASLTISGQYNGQYRTRTVAAHFFSLTEYEAGEDFVLTPVF
ncbi:hypothetical protein GCK32_006922 [Trichostrongylus colubriformis]|uniref:Uncharacterized protein n=1 Tax=Trichostrongylus colubriformis TaxID=6319 RepID=A0AAN8IF82_TRICO